MFTRNWRIYRRVADGAEPKAENDRFVLDQFWRRADHLRKQYEEWIDDDPEFSQGEGDRPFVRLLLVADLWQNRGAWANASLEYVRAIMSDPRAVLMSVPFDTVFTSAGGSIARQLQNNDPHNLGLTWRFHQSLVSDVLILLNLYTPDFPEMLSCDLDGYDGADDFTRLLIGQGHRSQRVVDLNHLFNLITGFVNIQQRLMATAGWTQGYFVKAKLLNVWRTIPFVDAASVLSGFEQHGVPMCLDSSVTTPVGTDPETFAEVREFADIENEHVRVVLQTVVMFAPIARAFGLPAWIDHDPEAGTRPFYEELQAAGVRAMEVQRRRNKRLQNERHE